jgi:hypothetical protein
MLNPIIRTIYLYLFTLVGLAMLVTGTARMVDLGLKMWVFTQADNSYSCPAQMPTIDGKPADPTYVKATCEEEQARYVTSSRQQQASSSLGMIIVGFPLYLYHWLVIKKDRKEKR